MAQVRQGAFDKTLFGVEVTTMVAGLVAAAIVVVTSRNEAAPPRHDELVAAPAAAMRQDSVAHPAASHEDAAPALAAKSACNGGAGTLAKLHAWLDGAELSGEPTRPQPPIDDAMRARGAELFAKHCATCHGARGGGDGPTAAQLVHPPANFTLGVFELRTTEHEALPADIDMFRTISRGVHGTAMPPWFALPERDRWALAAHLKTLSKQFAEDEAPKPVDVSHAPAVTSERVAHGGQLYATAGCASCHGNEGRGDGPAAAALTYKSGAPAHPRDLRAGRFHRGTRPQDVYLTVVTGLDGTPMASFAKVMQPDDLWDVAMFVAQLAPSTKPLKDGTRCPERAATAPSDDELVAAGMIVRSFPTNR